MVNNKDLKNSEKYNKIRQDLLDQLDRNGTYRDKLLELERSGINGEIDS
jgi:hypothetical protein